MSRLLPVAQCASKEELEEKILLESAIRLRRTVADSNYSYSLIPRLLFEIERTRLTLVHDTGFGITKK